MASSFSIFSPQVNLKHDVFLSFRGEDTRENFTSHLNAALNRRKIRTFVDYQLVRGDEISSSLLNAIEESKVSVIIFSEGYASSRWCLEELVKILECRKTNGQIVIPVFYRVDPSNIRNQTGAFGDGFAELKERFKEKLEMLQRWSDALTEAANLSGFNSLVIRPESDLTEKIVDDILKRLNNMSSTYSRKDLVGVESKIEYIINLLCIGSNDVCVVGIWGIGGIGKTTLANSIFNKISNQFEAFYFAENVREASEKGGLIELRKELLSTILEDENPNIRLTFTKERLNRKKVLIVFDDVTCVEQINKLVGEHALALGSRVMITTRDKQVLKCCGVNDANIYQVEGLCNDDSLQLFIQYAFRNIHPTDDYMIRSNEVVKYAQGVPLAIKVLGSFLLGRTIEEWESGMDKLKKYPHMDIQKVLQISYEGLDNEQKDIFLDIVFFFKHWDRDLVEEILNACDFSAQIGISVLIDRALITIACNTITMHDLLQEMGREIVRQESIDNPGKRSRLWHHKDIRQVLTKKRGTNTIRGLCFDTSEIEKIHINRFASSLDNLHINPLAFSEMNNLRFLRIYNSKNTMNIKVDGFEGLEFDSSELRCLYWDEYLDRSLPTNFHPENLVLLKMRNSNLEQLWVYCQDLANLRYIDLSHSHNLLKIPDLSRAPNLKSLELEDCTSLFEITPPLNQSFGNLVNLNLRNCTSLRYLPMGIQSISNAIKVNLENCSALEGLPNGISKLKSLKYLNISGCSKIDSLPEDFGDLESLEVLKANGIAMREVPSSIFCLKKLRDISFEMRCNSQEFEDSILRILSSWQFLRSLNLNGCGITELPNSLDQLSSLRDLELAKNDFESIPASIINLSNLWLLDVSYCKRLQSLPILPCNIQDLRAEVCNSLRAVSGLIIPSNFYYNGTLSFINSFNLDQNALRVILNDALLKMYLDTILWLQFAKDGLDKPMGCICFPGSEIPEWFNFRSSGFSIKLPQGSFNNNFLGFFFCTVIQFSVLSDATYSSKRYWHVEYELNLNIDRQFKTVSKRRFPVCKPDTVVSSDHVFLWCNCNTFDFREFIDDTEAIINFNFINEWHHKDVGYVKKCGVHLFYTQEFEEPTRNSTRFFILDEEEEQSSSRCGMLPEYGKEVEAFNQMTYQSSSFTFLGSNQFSKNFDGSMADVITTSDQNRTVDSDGKDNGSGNCEDQREPKRLKRYQILRHGEALSCSFVGWAPSECD